MRQNVPESMASGAQLVPAGAHCNHVTMTLQEQLGQYYAHISAVDTEIGRLLTKLEETDALAETLIAYSSDHGDMLGSHGKLRKGAFFRESAQVPLVLAWPGKIAAGQENEMLFGLIDIYPTLLGLCGLDVPDTARGEDLSTGILAKHRTGARYVVHFSTSQDDLYFRNGSRGLRTLRHLYFTDGKQECLFDTSEDPFEMRDLAADKAYADLKAMLAECLRRALPPSMSIRPAS